MLLAPSQARRFLPSLIAIAILANCSGDSAVAPQPGPFALTANGGDNQSATVGAAVATRPSVIVKDANGNPVPGVLIEFSVSAGDGQLIGATARTGDDGIAAVGLWTLGTTAGPNTLTAKFRDLEGTPVTFTATGTPGAAAKLVFLTQPSNAGWETAIAPAVSVQVQDQYSNVVTSSSDPVVLTLGANPGGATLGGGAGTTPVDGVATFDGLTLSQPGTGYTLVAKTTSGAQPSATSAAFNVSTISVVATTGERLVGLAVAGQSVYFSTGPNCCVVGQGTVWRVPAIGGAVTAFSSGHTFDVPAGELLNDGTYVDALELAGTNTRRGSIQQTAIADGAQHTLNIGYGTRGPNTVEWVGPDFEFDGTNFYLVPVPGSRYSDSATPVELFTYIISIRASDGAINNLLQREATYQPLIAVADGQLYYTDSTAAGITIQKMSVNGGPSTTVVSGVEWKPPLFTRRNMVVVGNTIYWGDTGTIRSAPTAGGTATTRATGLTGIPQNMVSDGSFIYFSDGGSLRRLDLSNFSVVTIADDKVGDIELDGPAVYWTSLGTTMAVKKTLR